MREKENDEPVEVQYSRYALVDEEQGMVYWYENRESAERDREPIGGEVVEVDSVEAMQKIRNARNKMNI